MFIILLALVGCGPSCPQEQYVGNGMTGTVTREGEYDLNVIGNGHNVTVSNGAVRNLNAEGTGHRITVKPGVEVQAVTISGVGIKVYLPAGSKAQVTRSGIECDVIIQRD
jgi:hypothetical protein